MCLNCEVLVHSYVTISSQTGHILDGTQGLLWALFLLLDLSGCAVRCAGVKDALDGTLIFGGKFLGKVFLTI